MENRIRHDHSDDGVDRRGFLRCMAWAGTGLVWTVAGGILGCRQVSDESKGAKDAKDAKEGGDAARPAAGTFSFVQISDSHIGFSRPPNTDVTATLQEAVARINALPQQPAFVLHTGDLTHLATPQEFDTVAQVLRGLRAGQIYCVPGEHDIFTDEARSYLERYGGREVRGTGWRSFDHRGVHFIGLVNVMNLQAGRLGVLGREQLDWLRQDVAGLTDSTPIVVFAHVPLWTVYPQWGWGTEDGAQALALLRRFGSVTVLNGHVHQILQRVEGNVTFHTARSTAFPQPAPGSAPSPGPVRDVPAGRLRSLLGVTSVTYAEGTRPLAVTDTALG
jgi:3',5'-cyclic AMP phosphodiesterase CpdA